jgi:GT2 family glycosyltransferase
MAMLVSEPHPSLSEHAKRLEPTLNSVRRSSSWGIAAPLRSLKRRARPLIGLLERLIRTSPREASSRIANSGLFDAGYYLAQNLDLARAGVDPLLHYLRSGAREGRDPGPLFNTSYYLEANPDVAQAGVNPLVHYLMWGGKERRDPSPLFDTSYYLEANPDVAQAGVNPLAHYVMTGAREGRDPSPLFDTSYYLDANPDVALDGVNPLAHYVMSGVKEGRDPGPLFDTSYYLETNPGVAKDGVNPLAHYVMSGARAGRDPSPFFDTSYYLETNPDVAQDGVNPLVHYVMSGAREGRDPSPLFDTSHYLEANPDVARDGVNPLAHYVMSGCDLYRLWVRENEPSRQELSAQRERSAAGTRRFSLMTFVTGTERWDARQIAESVLGQSYPWWEWILVATEDSTAGVRKAVAPWERDRRLRVLCVPAGSHRADAWNAALRGAQGEFGALLDQHDRLAPSALYEMAGALDRAPACDLLYSDEDRISRDSSERSEPRFKPGWSPDLLLASNYIGRMAMIRVAAATAAGGFRRGHGGHGGVEEWDLMLRVSRATTRILRVPRCLYHRGEADVRDEPEAPVGQWAGEAIVRDHCEALGLNAAVSRSAGGCRVVWPVQGQPLVSIVIPNRNAAQVLKHCVHGLLHETRYPNIELVIVDNGSNEAEVVELYGSLEREGRAVIVRFDRPFNFSAACNAGAAAARGDLLLFLNNDVEVIQPDWLDELVRWAGRPDVGIVGAKLLYPDRTIQHAGIVFGLGFVNHIFSKAPEGTSGVFGSSECYRNYLAVTGACQMLRKDVFRQLGGYDERFRLSASDVVLCLEAWKAGYRVVYTPYARLVHHESYTRKRADSPHDMELLARYLQAAGFVEDPYLHPELDPKFLVPAVRLPFDPSPRQFIRECIERMLSSAGVGQGSL